MYQLELKGMPSVKASESMDVPFPLIEILRMPWAVRVSADDAYAHGNEILRWLIDQTPLTNSKKYVNIYVSVHYLKDNYLHVPTTDWHCDGSNVPFLADDILHTMICTGDGLDGQVKTEFLSEDMTIEVPDEVSTMGHIPFRRWITANKDTYGIQPVECEAGKIYTWTSRHLHRVGFPTSPHFRMFWKVAESDLLIPAPKEQGFKNITKATIGNNGVETFNIEQGQRGIIMRGITTEGVI